MLKRKEASARGGRSVCHGECATQAAVDAANAMIRDAQFDLDHCRITAHFTGRMGTHLVSVGNLIAGNRGGVATTLLATIVSVDPIYLDFDMSEADYMTFARERATQRGPLADKLQVSLRTRRASVAMAHSTSSTTASIGRAVRYARAPWPTPICC